MLLRGNKGSSTAAPFIMGSEPKSGPCDYRQGLETSSALSGQHGITPRINSPSIKGAAKPRDIMMKTLMLVILAVMVGSILSILIIKPFSHNSNGENTEPPKTIQQPDPQK